MAIILTKIDLFCFILLVAKNFKKMKRSAKKKRTKAQEENEQWREKTFGGDG